MTLLNKVLFTSALALPSLLPAASAGPMLQVYVPFAFMVGTQQFTAGNYRVQQTDNGVVFVQGEGKAAAALTVPSDLKSTAATGLRFSGAEQHQLTSVQVQGESARTLATATDETRRVTLTSSR